MDSLMRYYHNSLSTIPAPGCGCHPALLGVANRGIRAGLSDAAVFNDIRTAIPPGKRRIPDREIADAIHKAREDYICPSFIPTKPTSRKISKPIDGKLALRRIINQSRADTEVDLWEMSPIRIDWHPCEDTWRFLAAMFSPDDLVFIGNRYEPGQIGKNICVVSEWIQFFQNGGTAGPFILINPLTGGPAPTKSGDGITYRGDGCIASYRYALAEFDNLTFEEQIAFWTGAKLPVTALIHSGGKSVHAWLRVDVKDADTWTREIKEKLYGQALIPIGVDAACSNPARLARLPGCRRGDKWQRVLYMESTQ